MKNALGETLRKARKFYRLRIADVAADINIAPQNYNAYETGLKPPNYYTLKRISKYYGIPFAHLEELFRKSFGCKPPSNGGGGERRILRTVQERMRLTYGWTDKDRYDQTTGVKRP